MTDLVERLEPCPFCGGDAKVIEGKDAFENYEKGVGCDCGATISFLCEAFPYDTDEDTSARAQGCIARWNRRAENAEITRLREEVERHTEQGRMNRDALQEAWAGRDAIARRAEAAEARLKELEAPASVEIIAAAWAAWHSRHGGKLGPGPGFVEAINAALRSRTEGEG